MIEALVTSPCCSHAVTIELCVCGPSHPPLSLSPSLPLHLSPSPSLPRPLPPSPSPSPPPSQKTLRGSKIGTLTKKFKAPEITEEDKLRAACEVQKNAVKASIVDLWRKLQVLGH